MKNALILVLLALLAVPVAHAQVVTTDYVVMTGRYIANSGVVTSANIPIRYKGSQYPQLAGVVADSMKIEWVASDSVQADVATATTYGSGVSLSSYTTRDSIKTAERDSWLITRSVYSSGVDEIAVKYTARASGNAYVSTNQYVYMRVRQYFTLFGEKHVK